MGTFNFDVLVEDGQNKPIVDATVELWDAEGVREAPFIRQSIVDDYNRYFLRGTEQGILGFYGRPVVEFYLRVVTAVQMPTADGGVEAEPRDLEIANTRTDSGSWQDQETYKSGIIKDIFNTRGPITIRATGQYHYFFIYDDKNNPLADVDLSLRPVDKATGAVIELDLPTMKTNQAGRAVSRTHSLDPGNVELQLWQKRLPLSDRLLKAFSVPLERPLVKGEPGINVYEFVITPEFGGTLQIRRYDEHEPDPLSHAIVEVRDAENMEKGPLRSLVTDVGGEVEIAFGYHDLIQYFGRYVDRFFLRVLKEGRTVINTLGDTLSGQNLQALKGDISGVWSLSRDPSIDGMMLDSLARFADLEILDAQSEAPNHPGWVQLFGARAVPEMDEPIDIGTVDSKGFVRFRRADFEEDSYFFRYVEEGEAPIDLRSVDAPFDGASGAAQGAPGYWRPATPYPDRQDFRFHIERGRYVHVSGRLVDMMSGEPLAGVWVHLFGNTADEVARAKTRTSSGGFFHVRLPEFASLPGQLTRNKSRLRFENSEGQAIPVRNVSTPSGEPKVSYEFLLKGLSAELRLEADLTEADGILSVERSFLLRLEDTSGGQGLAPAAGFIVRATDKEAGIDRGEATANRQGYASFLWSELRSGHLKEERRFDFEVLHPDGTVVATFDAVIVNVSGSTIVLEADLSPTGAGFSDIFNSVEISKQTPYQFLEGVALPEVVASSIAYREAVIERKLVDHYVFEHLGETRTGFSPSIPISINLSDSCDCGHCESVFSHLAYLLDLIEYAASRVETGGPVADIIWWGHTLGQSIATFPMNCQILERKVSVARIAVEVLRRKLDESGDVSRAELIDETRNYREVAYEALLNEFGVSVADLLSLPSANSMLPNAQERRKSLARNLGIDEADLEHFQLDPSSVGESGDRILEKRLEALFGLRATEDDIGILDAGDDGWPPIPDPFLRLEPPLLLTKQREYLSSLWKEVTNTAVSIELGASLYSLSQDTISKFDGWGREVWSASMPASHLLALAVDPGGPVFIAGDDGDITKVDSEGQTQWSFTLRGAAGTGSTPPAGVSLAVDGDQNVLVGDSDGQLWKLDPVGNEVWTTLVSSDGEDPSSIRSVAVDTDGNVFGGDEMGQVFKYDKEGQEIWKISLASGGDEVAVVTSVAVDGGGNIFVGDEMGRISKFDWQGQKAHEWSFPAHSGAVKAVLLDSAGYIYSASTGGAVRKSSAGGQEVWSFLDHDTSVEGLAIDRRGFVSFSTETGDLYRIDNSGAKWARFRGETSLPFGILAVEPGIFGAFPTASAPENLLEIPYPLIDPRIVGLAEPIEGDPEDYPAAALLETRRQWLTTRLDTLGAIVESGGADADIFDDILAATQGLRFASSDIWEENLNAIVTRRFNELTFKDRLLFHFLELSDLDLITRIHDRIKSLDSVTTADWEEFVLRMVSAEARSQYQGWREEERALGIVLGPPHFHLLTDVQAGQTLADDADPGRVLRRRQQWENLLRGRYEAWENLEVGLDDAIAATEAQAMPLLRSTLITKIAEDEGATLDDRAEWCTDEFLIDMRLDGGVKVTRHQQAVESVRTALFRARLGTLDSSAVALDLDPYDFDEVWNWLGDYSSWSTAVSVLSYPENFLGTIPRRLETSAFSKFREKIDSDQRFNGDGSCEAANSYSSAFRELTGMSLLATCHVRLREQKGSACTKETFVGRDRLLIFAKKNWSDEGSQYVWSKVRTNSRDAGEDPELLPPDFQEDWQSIPFEHEKIRDVYGAVRSRGEVLLFYSFVDDGEEDNRDDSSGGEFPILAALCLNLQSGEWERTIVPAERHSLPPTSKVFITQEAATGKAPVIVVQIGGIIRWCTWPVADVPELEWNSMVISDLAQGLRSSLILRTGSEEQVPDATHLRVVAAVRSWEKRDGFLVVIRWGGRLCLVDLERTKLVLEAHRLLRPARLQALAASLVVLGDERCAGVLTTRQEIVILVTDQTSDVPLLKYYRFEDPTTASGLDAGSRRGALAVEGFDTSRLAVSSFAPHFEARRGIWLVSKCRVDYQSEADEDVVIAGHEFELEDGALRHRRCFFLTPRTMLVPANAARILGEAEREQRRLRLPDLLISLKTEASPLTQRYVEELYFFVPLLLAQRLKERGEYLAALDWLRTIFDYATPPKDRYVYPRLDEEADARWGLDVEAWLHDPLDPHAIASLSPGKYKRHVIFEVGSTLLNAGNDAFRLENDAARSRAREFYRQAVALLKEEELLPSLPEGCDLDEFEEELSRELDGLRRLDQPGIRKVRRELEKIESGQQRLRAADGVLDAVRSESGSPEKKLLIALRSSETGDPPKPLDFFRRAQADEELRGKIRQEIAAGDLDFVRDRLPRLKKEAAREFRSGIVDIFDTTPRELRLNPPVGLDIFLSSPSAQIVHWPDVRLDLAISGNEPQSRSLAKRQDGKNEAVLQAFTPAPHPTFCAGPNPVFDILQTELEGNLTKLRLDLTFGGTMRPVAPARDMGLQTAYAAIRGNTDELLGGASSAPATQYRFSVLLQMAKQFLSSAARLEAGYLSAWKDHDNEAYRIHEASQGVEFARASEQVAELRLRAADAEIVAVAEQIRLAELKRHHYQGLLAARLNAAEEIGLGLMALSTVAHLAGPVPSAGAGFSTSAALSQTIASYQRREQEWRFQSTLAAQEVRMATFQSRVRTSQRNIAEAEKRTHQLQVEHANQTLEFLKNQFTSAQFYRYLIAVYRKAYADVLDIATEIATMAFHQLRFERQEPMANPIAGSYYDETSSTAGANVVAVDGSGGTARLESDLVRLEQLAIESMERRLNVSKTFSIREFAPEELLRLRAEGRMHIHFSLEQFDRAFPGQYHRLIENVRVSFVALTPPVQGVNASLQTLGGSRIYADPTVLAKIPVRDKPQRIDFTSPDGASGVFELDPQSELLRPFEGVGVETDFVLDVPLPANHWDLSTIQDVLLTIDYTAKHSAAKYSKTLERLGTDITEQRVFSLRDEFSDEWYKLINADLSVELPHVEFALRREFYRPNLFNMQTSAIRLFLVEAPGADGLAVGQGDAVAAHLSLNGSEYAAGAISDGVGSSKTATNWPTLPIVGAPPDSSWRFSFPDAAQNKNPLISRIKAETLADIVLIIEYDAETASWPGH